MMDGEASLYQFFCQLDLFFGYLCSFQEDSGHCCMLFEISDCVNAETDSHGRTTHWTMLLTALCNAADIVRCSMEDDNHIRCMIMQFLETLSVILWLSGRSRA
jgi:hypothetical protein